MNAMPLTCVYLGKLIQYTSESRVSVGVVDLLGAICELKTALDKERMIVIRRRTVVVIALHAVRNAPSAILVDFARQSLAALMFADIVHTLGTKDGLVRAAALVVESRH